MVALVPGKSLGPFRLGQRISEVLAILEADDERRRLTSLKKRQRAQQRQIRQQRQAQEEGGFVEIVQGQIEPENWHNACSDVLPHRLLHHTDRPLEYDIVIDCPSRGFQLRFDPVTQKLWVIDCYDLHRLELSYSKPASHGGLAKEEVFSSGKTVLPSFAKIYKLFGPTFPGYVDKDVRHYCLAYRGVTFYFAVPENFQSLYTRETNKMPLQFPDGTQPAAKRVFIHAGSTVSQPELPTSLRADDVYATLAFRLNEEMTRCTDFAISLKQNECIIRMNDTVQRVLSELGSPSAVYDKISDQMRIHQSYGTESENVSSIDGTLNSELTTSGATLYRFCRAGYFFNYYEFGIDILFDGVRHTVQKIICHGNFPGHPNFGVHQRCHFSLQATLAPKKCQPEGMQNSSRLSKMSTSANVTKTVGLGRSDVRDCMPKLEHASNAKSLVIASINSTWQDVKSKLEASLCKPSGPMLSTAQSELDGACASVEQAPYTPSLLYAVPGCIFEVLEGSGHITTLTLFSE